MDPSNTLLLAASYTFALQLFSQKRCEQKPQLKYVLSTIWRQISLPSLSSNDKYISNILHRRPLLSEHKCPSVANKSLNLSTYWAMASCDRELHLHQSASMFKSRKSTPTAFCTQSYRSNTVKNDHTCSLFSQTNVSLHSHTRDKRCMWLLLKRWTLII